LSESTTINDSRSHTLSRRKYVILVWRHTITDVSAEGRDHYVMPRHDGRQWGFTAFKGFTSCDDSSCNQC
jgi:hypothetical protein